jgi:hypothetical protein
MNKASTDTRASRLESALKSVKDWKAGKTSLKTSKLDEKGGRQSIYQSYEENLGAKT